MRITKINFEKIMPTGAAYLNERYGIEYGLEVGDDPKLAFEAARQMIEEMHKEKYPHLYLKLPEYESPLLAKNTLPTDTHDRQNDVLLEKWDATMHAQSLENEIRGCKSLEELKSFNFIIKADKKISEEKRRELYLIHDNKKKELQKAKQ
jgi:hypothetical protein